MAHHAEPHETEVTPAQAHDGHKAVDQVDEEKGQEQDGVAAATSGVDDRPAGDVPGDDEGGEVFPADEKQRDKEEGEVGPNGQAPDPTKMAPSPAQGVKSVLKSGIFGGSPKSSPGKPSAKTQTPGVSAPTRTPALSASTSRVGLTGTARPGITAPRTVPPSPKVVTSAPTRLRAVTGTAAAPAARARVSLAPPPKPRSTTTTTSTATASTTRLKEPFKPTSTRPAGQTKAAAAGSSAQSVNGTAAAVNGASGNASGASSPSIPTTTGTLPVTSSRARASLAPAPASIKATRPTSRVLGTPSTSTSGAKPAVPRAGGPSVTTTTNATGARPRASVAPARPGVAPGPRLASSRSSVDKANGSAEMKAQIDLLQSQLETEQREHEAKLAEMAAERAEVEKSALELAQLDKTSGPSDQGQKEIDEIKALHEAELRTGQEQREALAKELDEKCASLIRERDALQAAVESNKQVLVLTETKLSETTSSLAAAHGHIAELNHTVAENAATIESTSAAQRELEERVRVMKAEFERIGDGREVLEYENNRLERQLRELTEARERELEAGDELKKVKAELRRHEEESEKVKAELERLEQKTEERREESADAEQNLVEELDLARNETELAEAELARVKSELESSSARLAARESEGDAWKAERASTSAELEKLREEAESLAAQLGEKDRVYKAINAEYESLREAHDGLTTTHATLVQMHAEHENTLGNLNCEVSSLRAEIGELKSQLEQKTRDGEMVAKEKIELSTRVEDLQRQLASAQAGSEDSVELEQKLKSVQEERDGLVTKGDSALAEIEALKAEAVVDKGRMDDLEHRSQELDGRVKHLEGELEIKIAEGATLGERLEAIKADAARQAQELESKVVELGSRAEAAEAAEAKVEAAEEKLQAAEQQLHTSISRAKELEQKTLELEKQLTDATSTHDDLAQAAEIERSNIDALRVEHAREVESLGETVSSLKSQLERLADEHQKALETMSAEHEQSLLRLKDELAARAAGAGQVAQALDAAKRDLEAATGDLEQVKGELTQAQADLEEARIESKERDGLVKRLAEMEERLANGAEEAQRLEGELQEVKSLRAQLESQLASAERELEELKQREEDRNSLQERVEGLARDLEEVTKKLDSTTSELEDARQATKSGGEGEVALRKALEDVREELDMTKSVLEMNKSHFAEQLDHTALKHQTALDSLTTQSENLLQGKRSAEAVIEQMTDEVKRLQRDLEDERAARTLAAAKLSARTPPMSPPSDTTSPSSITKLHEAHNAKVAELETTIRKLAGELDGKHDGAEDETF